MHPNLAALYGIEKTASEASEGVDLTQISAADYLSALSEDEVDLNQISAADYLAAMSDEDDDSDELAKMASDGSFEQFELAGRIMARAYMDEMSKVASDDEDEIYDLSEISAADLEAALESGEYELVQVEDDDDLEKEAASKEQVMAFLRSGAKATNLRSGASRVARAAKLQAKATKAGYKIGKKFGKGRQGATMAARLSGKALKGQYRQGGKVALRGLGEVGAVYGAPGAAAVGGAMALRKKSKKG